MSDIRQQRHSFEDRYGKDTQDLDQLYGTEDRLLEYLRDRRLAMGFAQVLELTGRRPADLTVLVVCAGVGGEGRFFMKQGCRKVVVADFSMNAMRKAARDPALVPVAADAERLPFADRSVDLVVVQDGLHHLPRPTLGFTEMLRVAGGAVIMIEPHRGAVATAIGTRWEQGTTAPDIVNFVFRWDARLLEQVLRSYLLKEPVVIRPMRIWDHRSTVNALVERSGLRGHGRLRLARSVYGALQGVAGRWGNMMVAVIVRSPPPEAMATRASLSQRALGRLRAMRPRPSYAAEDET